MYILKTEKIWEIDNTKSPAMYIFLFYLILKLKNVFSL